MATFREQAEALIKEAQAACPKMVPGEGPTRWHWWTAEHARRAIGWMDQLPAIQAEAETDPVFAAALCDEAAGLALHELAHASFCAGVAGVFPKA